MRRLFGNYYYWLGLVFIVYAIVRTSLALFARLPSDVPSTVITAVLLVLGGILIGLAYRQVR